MAIQILNTQITLDLYDYDKTPAKIKTIQLDSKTRYVDAIIQYRGVTYDIGQDTEVVLTVIRPDGIGVQITGEPIAHTESSPEGGAVTTYGVYAEFTPAALAKKGTLKAQFMLISGDQVMRTEIFTIANEVALDESTDTWAGEYQGYNLDELVQNVNSAVATVEGMEQDVSELKSGLTQKVSIEQGVAHAGEALIIGADGNVTTGEAGVSVDPTLTIEGKAADAKAVGDGIRALSDLNPNGTDIDFTVENGTWTANKSVGDIVTPAVNNNARRAIVDLSAHIGNKTTIHFNFSAAQTSRGPTTYLCNSSGVISGFRSELFFQAQYDGDLVYTPTEDNCFIYLSYTAAKVSSVTINAIGDVAQNIADIPQIKADVAEAVKTVRLTNLCENGNIDDTTGFTVNSASVVTITASDNELTVTPLARNAEVFYAVPTSIVAGHKYYIGADIKTAGNMQSTFIRLQQYSSTVVNLSSVSYDLLNADTWQRLSMAYTSGFETSAGTLRFNLKNTTASAWANIYLRRIVIIDLTEAFGEWNEPDTGAIDAIIAKYAENSYFDGQLKTNVITQEVYSANAHKEPIYVGVSGYVLNVNAKYSADKDISYTIGKTGSNSIFNFRYPSFISNTSMSVSSKVNLSQVIPIETDWLSPEKLKVPSEAADGDMPDSDNFTGGNHAYNGDSSGTATAETSAFAFYVDGRKVTEYSGYAHYVDVYWTNLVQATNTKKADGTGRAVMQEDFHAHFDGVKWTIDARFTALEALSSWSLYGMQCRRGSTWNGYVFYHDSPNNRTWNIGTSASNSGGVGCKCVTIRKDADYMEMHIDSDGLGDLEMSANNSFFSSNDKTYSNLVVSARDISANSIYTYKGFYRFYSVA